MVEATPDGGLTINDSSVGVTQLDTGGNVLGTAAYLQGASPLTMTWWVGLVQGIVGELYSPDGSNGIPSSVVGSTFPTPKANFKVSISYVLSACKLKWCLVVDGACGLGFKRTVRAGSDLSIGNAKSENLNAQNWCRW